MDTKETKYLKLILQSITSSVLAVILFILSCGYALNIFCVEFINRGVYP
jgi:hypothetical protein